MVRLGQYAAYNQKILYLLEIISQSFIEKLLKSFHLLFHLIQIMEALWKSTSA